MPKLKHLASRLLLSVAITTAGAPAIMAETTSSTDTIYVGTYTGNGSEGIYRFHLDRQSGTLKPQGLAAPIANPSFLALAPGGQYLLCCNEISDFAGKKQGAGTSFAINRQTGELTQTGQAASGGHGPCYVSITPDATTVLLANYGSGSVAAVPFNPTDGTMADNPTVGQHSGSSIHEKRQQAPHAHCILTGPDGQWAYAVDLGTDEVIAYPLDGKGSMDTSASVVTKTDKGAGPRHIAFHPNGKYAYTSNELNSSITAWTLRGEGRLDKIHTINTLPDDFKNDNHPAEVLVHPNGQFVYLTNRGHNSIAIFTIDQTSGKLTPAGHEPTRGDHPRGMKLSPDGTFLLVANQNSDNLQVFRIDPTTGLPKFTSEHTGINRPTAFLFLQ